MPRYPNPSEAFIIKGVEQELQKLLPTHTKEKIRSLIKTPLPTWDSPSLVALSAIKKRAPQCVKVYLSFLPEPKQ